MRIRVLSDLHIEFEDFAPAAVEADAVVLAGDIGVGRKGARWITSAFPHQRVVYVAGNHEYYRYAIPHLTQELTTASDPNMSFLECRAVDIGDVRFYGCTLWTDFAVEGDRAKSIAYSQEIMNDYRKIRVSPSYRQLRAEDTALYHQASVDWLRRECVPFSGRKVIVTHAAPSAQSLDPTSKGQPVNGAFASDLEDLIRACGALLWVHGHTHYCVDYTVGTTRVISNQRGYPGEGVARFNPDMVVEI